MAKPRKMTDKSVKALINKINKLITAEESYLLGPYSYFVDHALEATFEDCHFDDLDADAQRAVSKARRLYGSDVMAKISEHLTVEQVGVYTQENEIFSVHVGETDIDLPDDIVAKLERLTSEQRDHVAIEINAYLSEQNYLRVLNDERFVLLLDVEGLCSAMGVARGDEEEEAFTERKMDAHGYLQAGNTPAERRRTFKLLQGGAK